MPIAPEAPAAADVNVHDLRVPPRNADVNVHDLHVPPHAHALSDAD
jgi:hypothetical protein